MHCVLGTNVCTSSGEPPVGKLRSWDDESTVYVPPGFGCSTWVWKTFHLSPSSTPTRVFIAPLTRTARIWPDTGDRCEFCGETLKNRVSALFWLCSMSGVPARLEPKVTLSAEAAAGSTSSAATAAKA